MRLRDVLHLSEKDLRKKLTEELLKEVAKLDLMEVWKLTNKLRILNDGR